MATLTKEQYDKLTPWKDALRSAWKNSFVRVTATEFNKIAVIYNEVFEQPLRKGQMGCNTCRLNALSKLGELYYTYVPEEKKEEEKKPEKKTRAKKLDNKKEE